MSVFPHAVAVLVKQMPVLSAGLVRDNVVQMV